MTSAAEDYLADVGWDPQFGARPLKRAIQKNVEDPLARRMLEGEFLPGDTIVVDRGGDGSLAFTVRRAPEAARPHAAAQ